MSANLNLIIAPAPAETALPQTTSPRSATLAEGPSHPRQPQERKASNDDRQAFRRLIDADAKRTSPQADAASAAARAPDQQTTQRTRERIDRDDRSPPRTSPEDRDHSTDVLLFSVVVAPLLETAPVGLLENLHACPNVASDGSEESISQELNFQGDSARAATEFGLRQVIQQLADVPQQEFDGESLDRASLLSDTVAHTATDEKAARFVTIPTAPRFDELPAPDLTRHNQSAVTDASLSPEPNGPNAELIEALPALPEPVERLISDPSSPGNDAVAAPKEVAAATIAAPFAEIAKKPVVPNQAADRSGVNTTSPVEA
ncbi:MAG: hypothetical protein KF861_24505, partial [Planctomycetaceae bacterium]|nr:hypothetical protein [Planctomycetaceae bacterium]